MVMIVSVLSFLPKIKTEKMRAVKKVSERFVGEQCAEKNVSERLGGGSKCGLRRSRWRMMSEAKRATCKAGVLSREVAEGSYAVFG